MENSRDVVFESVHGRKSVYDLRFIDDGKQKPLLIFCHGFKGFKDWGHFNLIADEFAKAGLLVLKFNFSFNGGTHENPIDFPDLEAFSENNYLKEVQDVNHIIEMVKSSQIELENWNGEIFLLGHSRGGGMVTIVGSENKAVKKVVSWAGISDCISRLPKEEILKEWKETGARHILNGRTNQEMPMKYQFVEVLLGNENKLSIEKACLNMNKPQLIVHGKADLAVLVDSARAIKSWNPNASLLEIEDANHVFGGKHPFDQNELPIHTKMAVDATIEFLLN